MLSVPVAMLYVTVVRPIDSFDVIMYASVLNDAVISHIGSFDVICVCCCALRCCDQPRRQL
jgi:hypothetical protein